MCKKQEYLKSLNPKKSEKHILLFGKTYKLWREGNYLGEAIWTKDDNVGDSFQTQFTDEKGRVINQVYIADKWMLII